MLPGPDLLIPYLAAVALIELTPGPNMGYLAIVGSRWGRRAGFATVAGITLGLSAYLLAAVAGVAEIVMRLPWLYEALRWLGAVYLLWLAYETWRDEQVRAGVQVAAPKLGLLFLRGLAANLLNPKAALFYAVLLPGFTNPALGSPAGQALTLGAIHLAVATMIHVSIVLTASGLHPAISAWSDTGSDRWLRRAFAVGLTAIAAWMMWETRRG